MKQSLKISTFLILLFATISVQAQKKPIDHSVYDEWESIRGFSIPYNGRYVTYLINTQDSDRTLAIYDLQTGESTNIHRGSMPTISRDGEKMIFKIAPFHKETRDAKIKKKKPAEMPKDTLAIMNLKTKEITKYPYVKSYKFGKELTEYIAYQEDEKPVEKKDKEPADSTKKEEKKKPAEKKDKDAGKPLYILNLKTALVDTIKFVEQYSMRDDGKEIFYITKPSKKDSVTLRALYTYNPYNKESKMVLSGDKKAKIELPYINKNNTRYLLFAQLDTTKEAQKFMDIYQYIPTDNKEAEVLITNKTEGIPEGFMISDKAHVTFSDDGRKFFFSIKMVAPEKDTITPDFEKVKVDVWRWNADYLPTMRQGRDNARESVNYNTICYFDTPSKVLRLSDDSLAIFRVKDENINDYVLASTDKPYRIASQWDGTVPDDIYKVSLLTGERELIEKGLIFNGLNSSPQGNYYVWFDLQQRDWFIYELATGTKRNLTKEIGYPFWKEDTDTPSYPDPYKGVTWFEEEKGFILHDRYDIWYFDPTGVQSPINLTEGIGRKTKTRFSLTRPLHDPLASLSMMGGIIDPLKTTEPLFFETFDETTKETGIYFLDRTKKRPKLTFLTKGPYTYNLEGISLSNGYPGLDPKQRAPRKLSIPVFAYVKHNFENSPNVFITKDLFRTETKISSTNPQQSEYNWGTVELVNWMTEDSIRAEGLLFKPEDFDATKKYPLMIYFYEKYSDDLYQYRSPAPSRSTVNIPYFVSNGYVVFIPDIYYTVGHPGKSAMRSIMPAVDMLCENSWIDEENMAIQGQSWGGYQVAYMITQTDRFKAAGAGAPVSNMTSAYGGIRWGSGVTRQFQYEHGQSRIGTDLWTGFDLYVENSPLFFVKNVKTPVLIMHNDEDDAVPWYQGIEFFVGLKRHGKEAYMIQYIGETHNLSKRHNAKDLSVKLAEFFGYYLKGEPMPEWMKVK